MKAKNWAVLTVGTALMVAVFWGFMLLLSTFPPLFDLFPEGEVISGPVEQVLLFFKSFVPFFLLLLGILVVSMLVGRSVTEVPGKTGALNAGVAVTGVFVYFVWDLLPWIFVEANSQSEQFTRSDNVGTLYILALVMCAVLPLSILLGYAGGKIGGALRGRMSLMSA